MDFTKPRVAIYYDVLPQTGMRNDGAPLMVHYNLQKILNQKTFEQISREGMGDGGNVAHLSPINPTAQHGTFDLNILVDYGEDVLGIPINWEIPKPNAYWAFDVHIDEKGFQYRLDRAKQFDNVFLCHKAYINDFIRGGIAPERIHYLPVAAETDCYRPYPIMEKWDWCFIGHLNSPHRINLVDRFIKEFGLGQSKGYFGHRINGLRGYNVLDDAAKKFSMSRININDSIKNDLNMRTFEAMACRQLLLTEENGPLKELFMDKVHLRTFKTVDEAVEIAKEMLLDHERRRFIANAGYDEILDKHTYRHRTEEILETCIDYKSKGEEYVLIEK